ncbi:HlyD family efflux transporter periplasmic adaptor subunit [Sphingobacterium faecium]|uniref:HlyD family efflux transporter periplasmic adaptor subunit n=1 Tax=Sphingobacterium faecium TaxID=34087 RepID=UPI00320A6CD9
MEIKQNILTKEERTEEVKDIVERMPITFAKNVTLLVCLIVILLLFFGYIVKYPDIVTGEVTVSSEQSPLQIVAIQAGRLKINNIKSQDMIQPDQLLAWIDNPARPELIAQIKSHLTSIPLALTEARTLYNKLPKNLNLGDLTVPYSALLTNIKQVADYQDHKLYDKHEQSLAKILNEQHSALNTLKDKEKLSSINLQISDKYLERDSILLAKRLISQAEYEQSVVSHLGAEDQVKTSIRNSGSIKEQISSTENSIQQNKITKSEKEQQFDLELLTAYNNLIDKINLWEKQYLITSPVGGSAQFLKFWTNNQFVQVGEPLFSIVPTKNEVLGKVMLPVQGAGKVKMGQKVIVKMVDYPYLEYGYIEGEVNNISLVSSPVSVGNGSTIDSYLVTLVFPRGLYTNYGTQLDFRFEAKRTAEIITKDRRLIERFFDNLRYIGHSK